MEEAALGDDDEYVRYCQGGECVKKLPGYPGCTSQAAGNKPLPGRPGSKIWIAGKILSDFFRSRIFLAQNLLFKRI